MKRPLNPPIARHPTWQFVGALASSFVATHDRKENFDEKVHNINHQVDILAAAHKANAARMSGEPVYFTLYRRGLSGEMVANTVVLAAALPNGEIAGRNDFGGWYRFTPGYLEMSL